VSARHVGARDDSAREEVLARVRAALVDPPGAPGAPVVVPRGYRRADGRQPGDPALLELFVDRLEDYKAIVHRCGGADVGGVVADVLSARGTLQLVLPSGVPEAWTAPAADRGVLLHRDDPPLGVAKLDGSGSVLTGCAVAVADTGTIVLDAGADQGRRALTLVPDHHVCVVRVDQVVGLVPEALARLDASRPLTWISGPSATSDIELDRVEGVHGPRTLEVLIVG